MSPRVAVEAAEAAFTARLDQYMKDARAGTVKPTEWRPKPDVLRAWIDRSLTGGPSAYEPEAEHAPAVHVEPGEYSEAEMDSFRQTAFAALDEATQAAALDPNGPGFAAAAEAFDAALDQAAADAKAEQVAFRDRLKAENMAAHPENYSPL